MDKTTQRKKDQHSDSGTHPVAIVPVGLRLTQNHRNECTFLSFLISDNGEIHILTMTYV